MKAWRDSLRRLTVDWNRVHGVQDDYPLTIGEVYEGSILFRADCAEALVYFKDLKNSERRRLHICTGSGAWAVVDWDGGERPDRAQFPEGLDGGDDMLMDVHTLIRFADHAWSRMKELALERAYLDDGQPITARTRWNNDWPGRGPRLPARRVVPPGQG